MDSTEGAAMLFGEMLRELKDKAGLSEAKLAKKSGVAAGALHGYLLPASSDGHRKPSFENVAKIAQALAEALKENITCNHFAACDDITGAPPPKKAKKKAAK